MSIASPHPVYDEWLAAQAEAHKAECALMRAQLDHFQNDAAAVPAVDVERSTKLRARASALLRQALAEMRELARGLRL